jgi:lipopolysaccharide biosynthesis protein
VLYYLREIRKLGFRVCFISNSALSVESENALHACCERVIQRENTGYDFCMWKRALAEYDILQFDELFLTNSSIVGPLQALAPLWENQAVGDSDFWGLTDNTDYAPHLQSYFLVFRRRVIESECFGQFWKSVLPYTDKDQVIRSYELGITLWLEQHGFRWKPLYPQREVFQRYFEARTFSNTLMKRLERLKGCLRNPILPGNNTTIYSADLLIASGFPFLKSALLKDGNEGMKPDCAYELLKSSDLPNGAFDELHQSYIASKAARLIKRKG